MLVILSARLNKESVKIGKKSKRAKMSKRQKNISIPVLSYFPKQKRKESTEIKEHEQETDSSWPTCRFELVNDIGKFSSTRINIKCF